MAITLTYRLQTKVSPAAKLNFYNQFTYISINSLRGQLASNDRSIMKHSQIPGIAPPNLDVLLGRANEFPRACVYACARPPFHLPPRPPPPPSCLWALGRRFGNSGNPALPCYNTKVRVVQNAFLFFFLLSIRSALGAKGRKQYG